MPRATGRMWGNREIWEHELETAEQVRRADALWSSNAPYRLRQTIRAHIEELRIILGMRVLPKQTLRIFHKVKPKNLPD